MTEIQPEPDQDQDAELTPEQQMAMAAQAFHQGGGGWRPACAFCLNGHKLAIAELAQKLQRMGAAPGTPPFMEAMQQAAMWGQRLAQNPMALQGMNGTKPDIIPAVRPADTFIQGSAVCAICFMPQKATNLAIAPAGWTPRLG